MQHFARAIRRQIGNVELGAVVVVLLVVEAVVVVVVMVVVTLSIFPHCDVRAIRQRVSALYVGVWLSFWCFVCLFVVFFLGW